MTTLAERLVSGAPMVLDGGMGTLLENRGYDVDNELWSARLLLDEPDAVRDAHRAFYAAGAEIGISCTYQASYEGLERAGLDRDEIRELITRSVTLAREAAGEFDGGRYVAASVGPYGAMLADGSEFHGNYGKSVAELTRWHRSRLEAFSTSGADLLAIETIPSLAEVEALVAALAGSGQQAWVSLTSVLGASPSGEPLREGFQLLAEADEVVALGLNCSRPGEVLGAIQAAAQVSDKPIVVYPNSGEEWDSKNHRWIKHKTFTDALVGQWLQAGATVIGGCCRVDPEEIAGISALLHAGHAAPSKDHSWAP